MFGFTSGPSVVSAATVRSSQIAPRGECIGEDVSVHVSEMRNTRKLLR
jgi:hypothetical protein